MDFETTIDRNSSFFLRERETQGQAHTDSRKNNLFFGGTAKRSLCSPACLVTQWGLLKNAEIAKIMNDGEL